MSAFRLAGHDVGAPAPCFVIAEAGVNHNGDLAMARRLVDVAADAGADAVKFQSFHADALVTRSAPLATYQARNTGIKGGQLDLLRRLQLPDDALGLLADHAHDRDIIFLSSPFDAGSADVLEALDVPAYKLGSGELTNHPLVAHVAAKARPLILSTGMADLREVAEAVAVARTAGPAPLALLHCVSDYPAQAAGTNLRAMETLRRAFGVPVGLSDHALGSEVALAAVALGAEVLEKHFTLDPSLPGPDHRASADPAALRTLIQGVRAVEAALGDGLKRPTPAEAETARVARRSVVLARDVPAGARLLAEDLACKRPGNGLPPSLLPHLIGRRTARPLESDRLLAWEDLA